MSLKVKRLSDGTVHTLPDEFDSSSVVHHVKIYLKKHFAPKCPSGYCQLMYEERNLKSRHTLQHYDVVKGETIEMDDTKDWSSSSSDADSDSDSEN